MLLQTINFGENEIDLNQLIEQFFGLKTPFQILGVLVVFMLAYGITNFTYHVLKVSLWVSYKIIISVIIIILMMGYSLAHLIMELLNGDFSFEKFASVNNEKFHLLIKRESNVWPWTDLFSSSDDRVKA